MDTVDTREDPTMGQQQRLRRTIIQLARRLCSTVPLKTTNSVPTMFWCVHPLVSGHDVFHCAYLQIRELVC